MHVAVLGAGVSGITTAYYLAERGHSVTVVERASTVAAATSFANGGQLSYSYTDSLANPAFIPGIPSLLLGLDPAIRVKLLRNVSMVGWGLRFLGQCTQAKARANTVAVLKIALRSAELIDTLQQKLALDFSYRTVGKLVLVATQRDLQAAGLKSALKRQHGCETSILTANEAIAKEPALEFMQQDFSGAVYAEHDQVGDARAFTLDLSDWLQANQPVTVRLGEEITRLEVKDGRVPGVRTTSGMLHADATVVCLGPWSQRFLRLCGVDTKIYPVRGYSVTLPPGARAPTVSITSLRHRMVYSRLNDRVRIAGFADFTGFDTRSDSQRISTLLEIAERVAPEAADYGVANKEPWGGFRPVTPTGRPQVGPTAVGGLFVNTGHGALGWTLACATAESVATAVSNSE